MVFIICWMNCTKVKREGEGGNNYKFSFVSISLDLQNLIVNAIKYNLPNGWIKIQAYQQSQTVFICVSNASQDILDCDREHLFDRFYRGDKARSRIVC